MRKSPLAALTTPATLCFLLSVSLIALLLLTGCATTEDRSELATAYYDLGNAYMELEEWEKARGAYGKALEVEQDMRRAEYNLSRALIRLEEYTEAERRLTSLLEQDPQNGILQETLAWLYIRRGMTGRAEEAYRKVLEYRPQDASALYNLALLEQERENYAEARKYLIELVKIEKADAQVFYRLGQVETELGSASVAGWFAKAADREPENPRYRKALAEAYTREKSYEDAAKEYAELAERFPERSGVYQYRRAYVLLIGKEDYAQGLEALRAAFEAGFTDSEMLADLAFHPELLDPAAVIELLKERGLWAEVQKAQERGAAGATEEAAAPKEKTSPEASPASEPRSGDPMEQPASPSSGESE